METKIRYRLLDILRAFAIITMAVYHTLWDLVNIFEVNIPWFYSDTAFIMQQCIRWAFILISGFCWSLGGKIFRRGLTVLGGAFVIWIATRLFLPESLIVHGVLTLIGVAMLLTIPLKKVFSKIPPLIGFFACLLIFIFTYDVELGKLGFGSLFSLNLPLWLYKNNFTALFGFAPITFYSTDYVPILPWIFSYWMGFFLFKLFEKRDWLKYLSKPKIPPLEWLGRHSLIIYMIHQPIIYGLLYLIF
jgi:uncharacterized membrane protein